MGDERGDDAAERRIRADVYSSARIGAAAAYANRAGSTALTIVLVVLLILDVVVPDYHVSSAISCPSADDVPGVDLHPTRSARSSLSRR